MFVHSNSQCLIYAAGTYTHKVYMIEFDDSIWKSLPTVQWSQWSTHTHTHARTLHYRLPDYIGAQYDAVNFKKFPTTMMMTATTSQRLSAVMAGWLTRKYFHVSKRIWKRSIRTGLGPIRSLMRYTHTHTHTTSEMVTGMAPSWYVLLISLSFSLFNDYCRHIRSVESIYFLSHFCCFSPGSPWIEPFWTLWSSIFSEFVHTLCGRDRCLPGLIARTPVATSP